MKSRFSKKAVYWDTHSWYTHVGGRWIDQCPCFDYSPQEYGESTEEIMADSPYGETRRVSWLFYKMASGKERPT